MCPSSERVGAQFGTYLPEDVTVLLKDISGLVEPLPASEREQRIQSGTHYCEMLPLEYEPSERYLAAYHDAVRRYAPLTASAVASCAEQVWQARLERPVLVSLARAGTPIGILMRRYLHLSHGADVPHYTISIIRGRGVDQNAMRYVLDRHDACQVQFVDGWTGKGAIQRQLNVAMADFAGIDPALAVLSDPAGVAGIRGTRDDFLIPSSCLNSTVSGLLSRTFLRGDIIGPDDFHGAAFYRNFAGQDLTYHFISSVERHFPKEPPAVAEDLPLESGLEEVSGICERFGVRDVNLVKPGIGEATRVLLRRVPWKVLVRSLHDAEHLGHLYQLAREKDVPVEEYPLHCYRACGIIRDLADT